MSAVPLIATELVAVRGRISGQRPAVQRDAVPGDAQHVRHPGIVIEARAMVLVLLHDAEDAGWRPAVPLDTGARRTQPSAGGSLSRYGRPIPNSLP
jgi:hypothetical protein